jgi:hypothetical protein
VAWQDRVIRVVWQGKLVAGQTIWWHNGAAGSRYGLRKAQLRKEWVETVWVLAGIDRMVHLPRHDFNPMRWQAALAR